VNGRRILNTEIIANGMTVDAEGRSGRPKRPYLESLPCSESLPQGIGCSWPIIEDLEEEEGRGG
jgi:hypothetical protein